jgi:hypothetical protein
MTNKKKTRSARALVRKLPQCDREKTAEIVTLAEQVAYAAGSRVHARKVWCGLKPLDGRPVFDAAKGSLRVATVAESYSIEVGFYAPSMKIDGRRGVFQSAARCLRQLAERAEIAAAHLEANTRLEDECRKAPPGPNAAELLQAILVDKWGESVERARRLAGASKTPAAKAPKSHTANVV